MDDFPTSLSPDDEAIIQDLLDAHGFESLTDTQYQALEERILDGGNHMLVAETGNGKTLCAEAVTRQMLDAGGRVAYLVPSHQLVGAKHEELISGQTVNTISKNEDIVKLMWPLRRSIASIKQFSETSVTFVRSILLSWTTFILSMTDNEDQH